MSDDSRWASDAEAGRAVLRREAEAVQRLAEELDAAAFGRAIDAIMACKGLVVVTGIGKSGHIAAKVSATLASTGTPSFYLHPAEALHGDQGAITAQSVLLAFSQSGATDEVLAILPYAKRLGVPLIAITGKGGSPLAEQADVVLHTPVPSEADPLNLAPTASTVAQLAMGDAVAVALMRRRGFTPEDFAIRHPLGALGRRLLVRVSDLMNTGARNPVVREDAPLSEAIRELTHKRLGAVSIVDESGALVGVFTDGDLGRLFFKLQGVFDTNSPIRDYMIRTPKYVTPETLGVKAVDLMETYKITALPVLDAERHPVGMIHEHDLIRLGITT